MSQHLSCPNCGQDVLTTWNVCPNCGNPLPRQTVRKDTANAETRSDQDFAAVLPTLSVQPTKKGRRKWPFLVAGLALIILLPFGVVFVNVVTKSESDVRTTSSKPPTESTSSVRSSHKFDRSNYALLASKPEAFKGASVDVVGKVFGTVEKDVEGIYWQMWADPKTNEFNTAVAYADPNFALKSDDYVHVIGKVTGSFKGKNAFGGEVTAVSLAATRATVVDAVAAASPAKRTATLNTSQSQHRLVLILEKVEFADDETRVFLTVNNGSPDKASFYSFNAKAQQGSSQYDAESLSDYPDVQSELLPGVKSSGVLPFPRMDLSQGLKLILEARTDNYRLDFSPYIFEVGP